MHLKFEYDLKKNLGIVSGTYFDQLRDAFSVENDAYKFSKFRKGMYIPKKRYVVTPTGRFDCGLFFEFRKYLQELNPNVKLHLSEEFKSIINPSLNYDVTSSLSLDLRDYQHDIVDICLRMGRGVVVLATAGGKTLTMCSLLESIFHRQKSMKCLLIVPDLGLVNQTFNDFKEYAANFFFTKWTGNDKLNINSNVIICNAGILQSSKSDVSWIKNIDYVVVDEVHKLRKDNKINKIIKLAHTPNKFGFTGTLPESEIDQWNIFGKIGPVIYTKNSFQLRNQQYVANAFIQIIKLEYEDVPEKTTNKNDPIEKYRKEKEFISTNEFRNNVIKQLCQNFNNNSLILVDHIKHGEILLDKLQSLDRQVYFVRGDVDIQTREEIKQIMEKEKNIICIAISKIFATGISIKNLHYIVFASGGKAKIKILQSIGRGLRLHEDKSQVIIVDIADQLKYGYKHMNKRILHYKNENIEYRITKIRQKTQKIEEKTQ